MKAKVRFEDGQSRIELEYDDLKPAVLFGGDVTSYVLWAIDRDGGLENLGELWVAPGKEDDTVRFSTGSRSFALFITAEPYFEVPTPANFIIFFNDGQAKPPVRGTRVAFSDFRAAPRTGVDNLETVAYDSQKPLELVQAEKVLQMARSDGADKYAPAIFREAELSLEQATTVYQRRGARGAEQFARRSFAAANDAIRLTQRKKELESIEAEVAQRQQEMTALTTRLEQAEAEIGRISSEKEQAETSVQAARGELRRMETEKVALTAALGDLRSEREQLGRSLQELQAEKARLERDKEELQVEKTDLQDRLQSALSQVAETRESARGYIVNLPDILFDVNESTLKTDAARALSKLAGILLILEDLNLRIEGHTDSTGSASYNLRLSQRRAESVFDLLAADGISSERMVTAGYGIERPIADNTTTEGRQKNRRVEIIIAEGEVAAE
jgi:outer membrane protein OmpA-like peptidoglycan-associated protein